MKREIKFRAWHIKDKVMFDVIELGLGEGSSMCVYSKKFNRVRESNYRNEFEVMQYTGLKDKHGKEIYEGDIVRIMDEKEKLEVFWEYGAFFVNNQKLWKQVSLGNWGSGQIELLGNIYENSNLLDGKGE